MARRISRTRSRSRVESTCCGRRQVHRSCNRGDCTSQNPHEKISHRANYRDDRNGVSRTSRGIENGPRFRSPVPGYLETRNGIYFFNREKPITGLTPDDEIACWGASILPNDKGCWPMRGKSIEQILAVCPIGKTCQIAGVLKNLTHGLYCWTEVNSVIAK